MSVDSVPQLKILVCGDVCGQFPTLKKKITSINRKSGPFDMVFCVGDFFSPSPTCASDFETFKSTALPIPTFILGPNSSQLSSLYKDCDGYEICENLVFLGRQGLMRTESGLTVAYLSGRQQTNDSDGHLPWLHDVSCIQNIKHKLKKDDNDSIDVLLTSDWSYNVTNNSSRPPGLTDGYGSRVISELAYSLKPRYHFAALNNVHFERQPYRNQAVLAQPIASTTRFVGLARVGNDKKMKWIYAFNIIPKKFMKKEILFHQPSDVTECPYSISTFMSTSSPHDKAKMKREQLSSQFFYDKNARVEDMKNKRKPFNRNINDSNGVEKRVKTSNAPCWFCLSSPDVDKHLIISIGDHSYVALAKGPLTSTHVLITPVGHHASQLHSSDEVYNEIKKYKQALTLCFKSMKCLPVFFERNFKSQHFQIHAVAVSQEKSGVIKNTFESFASKINVQFEIIDSDVSIVKLAEPGQPYFSVELPSETCQLFYSIKKGQSQQQQDGVRSSTYFPIHFGREVLASEDLLNVPSRVDWKQCLPEDKSEELQMVSHFKEIFKRFDFTLDNNSDGDDD